MINLAEIKNKVDEVIKYSQGIEEPKTKGLMESWYNNKKHFIDKWGGLTYEVPNVSVEIDESSKEHLMINFGACCSNSCETNDIQNFILEQGINAFCENKVATEYKAKNNKTINKGMKMTKALKFFTDDKDALCRMQIQYSKYLQDMKFNGTLVMSVHPLDFLSSSENAHNWRSCHALDGEYRCGNLSYMLDRHTFICYVKSTKEEKLPNFPFEWNSKKWRVLMHMREDEKLVMAGKQYPFESPDILETLFYDCICKFYPGSWSEKWQKPPMNVVEQMMYDDLGSLHFNDCLLSSSYRPIIRYQGEIPITPVPNEEKMAIGDAVECLDCGKGMVSLSSCMRCDECGGYEYCDCCGEAEFPGDMYSLGDELLCERCFDEHGVYCEKCDRLFDIRKTELYWVEEDDAYYCECCHEEYVQESEEEKQDEEVCNFDFF